MSRPRSAWRPPGFGRRGPSEVNLARRPFVNERPVRRAALLLLLAGLGLTALNLWLYTRYAIQRGANEGELNRIEEEIESEERRVVALTRQLAAADLTQQNELVVFLNQRIAERTFGWSVLFDRLEDLLPEDVRLLSLSPKEVDPQERRRAPSAAGAAARDGGASEMSFNLAIVGVARQPEGVLELIDALFADAAFRDPDLHEETFQDGEVRFTLDVVYLPHVAEALVDAGGILRPTAGTAGAGAGNVLTPGAAADREPR